MVEKFYYFAYGSNMSHKRLHRRTPSARPIGRASLFGYRLRFDKISTDGSGKADCEELLLDDAPDRQEGLVVSIVWGGLYEIDIAERAVLDDFEGLGRGYEARLVEVELEDGRGIEALTYVATNKKPGLLPYTWYVNHVLKGAEDFCLPSEYVQEILTIPANLDPDPARHEKELASYQL